MTQGERDFPPLDIEVPIRVRYFETDKMGVVHHSNYIRYFEVARMEQFRAWGKPYDAVERSGLYLMVISVSCRCRAPAYFDEQLWVRAKIQRITKYRIKHSYEIRNAERNIVATGETVLACVTKAKVPVILPEFLLHVREQMDEV